jgi:hypothetical protein
MSPVSFKYLRQNRRGVRRDYAINQRINALSKLQKRRKAGVIFDEKVNTFLRGIA